MWYSFGFSRSSFVIISFYKNKHEDKKYICNASNKFNAVCVWVYVHVCAGGKGAGAVEITHPWKTKICNMMDLMVWFDKVGAGEMDMFQSN